MGILPALQPRRKITWFGLRHTGENLWLCSWLFVNVVNGTGRPNYFSHFFNFFLASIVDNPLPSFICWRPSSTLLKRRILSNNWTVSKLSGIFLTAESTCFFVNTEYRFCFSVFPSLSYQVVNLNLLFNGSIIEIPNRISIAIRVMWLGVPGRERGSRAVEL